MQNPYWKSHCFFYSHTGPEVLLRLPQTGKLHFIDW